MKATMKSLSTSAVGYLALDLEADEAALFLAGAEASLKIQFDMFAAKGLDFYNEPLTVEQSESYLNDFFAGLLPMFDLIVSQGQASLNLNIRVVGEEAALKLMAYQQKLVAQIKRNATLAKIELMSDIKEEHKGLHLVK